MIDFRTDLAIEEVTDEVKDVSILPSCEIKELNLKMYGQKKTAKKSGLYYTLSFDAVLEHEHDRLDDVAKSLSFVLKRLLKRADLTLKSHLLIVGLGNTAITPDSLGPKVINNIFVTKHLDDLNELDENLGIISAIAPGVMGQTGMETANIIKAIVRNEKPKGVIVIDALASKSIYRLNKTIQVTTAGINPGSGVGNRRKELSEDTLGVPVIAIGVPTVVDMASILYDAFSGVTNGSKMIEKGIKNIQDNRANFMVSSKTIDEEILMLSDVISKGINEAIHHLEDYE